MTAEVIIMNREAVALAADSAVTIEGSKIFTTAEKLFLLAPGHSVGVLIFNNAHFMELPWSAVIKLYRDKLLEGQLKLPTLNEYAKDFMMFLEARGNEIFPEEQQARIFSMTIHMFLEEVVRDFWSRIKILYEMGIVIGDEEVANKITEAIDEYHRALLNDSERYSENEHSVFVDCLLENYGSVIEEIRDVVFEKLPLTEENKHKIQQLCLFLFTKDTTLPYYTGVAFTGYGKDELFPSYVMFEVEAFLCNKLRHVLRAQTKIGFSDPAATVIPLAQRDITDTILGGIHPIYQDHLKTHLAKHLPEDTLEQILADVENDVAQDFTYPTMHSISAIPKGELAVIAETLVSMTSFMRKHSMDIESVGGETDVAVISKKDGFVWIKRKHYFDIGYNGYFYQEKK
jgi:hypothetical protein